jgi:ketosteroid isomerase-like protein
MDTQELAKAFAAMLAEGRDREASETFWAEDIVSREAMDGPMAMVQGREAIFAKHQWWYDNHEIHGVAVAGPFVNGDQFALRFSMDVTPKGGARLQMDEIGLYTVRHGKIVEERFFY